MEFRRHTLIHHEVLKKPWPQPLWPQRISPAVTLKRAGDEEALAARQLHRRSW